MEKEINYGVLIKVDNENGHVKITDPNNNLIEWFFTVKDYSKDKLANVFHGVLIQWKKYIDGIEATGGLFPRHSKQVSSSFYDQIKDLKGDEIVLLENSVLINYILENLKEHRPDLLADKIYCYEPQSSPKLWQFRHPLKLSSEVNENSIIVNIDNAEEGSPIANDTLQYSINEGETWQDGNTFTDLEAGDYTIVVKDVTQSVSINFDVSKDISVKV